MDGGGLIQLFSRMNLLVSLLCLLCLSSLIAPAQLGLDEVFFSPQDQTAREGETVFFPCVSGESSPPASISWLKDGKPVTRGRQIQGEYGGGHQRKTSGTLHLYNITLEDDGTYICVTFNPLLNTSKRSKPAKLTVRGVPRKLQILHGPDNITVAMGEAVSMRCAVGGFPVPMVHWFKDDCLLTNCSARFKLQNNGQLLTFRNVSKEHEGFYHCEAFNQKGRIKSQKGYLLLADMDWSFVEQPMNLTVKKGDNVTVTCRPPESRPPAQVTWFKNNQLLPPSVNVSVLPTGDLHFHTVHEDDSGSYFCRASNTHLQRFITSRRASVTVLAPPSVSVWPQLLTVPVGGSVALQCQVSGSPVPSITWFKSGLSKQTGGRVIKGLSNATLYIQSARSFDEGVYLCYASNSMGTNQSNAVLKVAVSPIIITFAAQVQCKLGAVASLPCKAVGIVPITYTWSKKRGNQHIAMAPNDQTYIDGEGSLHISDVQWSDEGEYYCTAKNRAGQHQKRAFLTVTDRVVLSANSSSDENIVVLHEPVAEQHLLTSTRPTHQTQTLCVSSRCNEPVKYFNEDTTTPQSLRLNPLTQTHSQYFVTQLPPPIFPPPPHPNFKSSNLQVSASKQPVYTENLPLKSPSKSPKDGPTQSLNVFKQQNTEAHGLFGLPTISILETASHFANTTLPSPLQVESQSKDSNVLSKLKHETALAPPQTWLEPPREPLHLKQGHQPDTTHSETSYSFTNTESSSISKQTQAPTDRSSLEKTTSPRRLQVQPPVFSTQQSPMNSQYSRPNVESFMLNQTASYSVALQTNRSNIQPVNQTNNASTLVNDFPLMNITKQKDTNERGENIEATEKSTSQSPRVTQQAPSWLPVLEKHDIPIVVGVGVSLAFIFITVTFYSMVQKNEPVPTNRAAQRNVGIPKRSASRRAAGRTYENRAFEDDECVAVIEQSPNTRARPPGPGLVTVQLEPTSEEQDVPPSPDLHSVTVETYPEPILDTKIDHSLEEESGLSLSQPSIQLQCAEDWLSGADDNHSPCQDTLPPPSPLLSPSPSLTPKQNESLRSSLTLQSGELSTAPIHHSLSLSHSNSPLLLSHQVSFGPTNVAVDVHFHPVSSPSISIQSSTQISSSSMLTAPVADPQETVHNK